MNRRLVQVCFAVTILALITAVAVAQRSRRWQREIRPGMVDRGGVPEWKNDEQFQKDVFTFVRVRYGSHGGWRDDKWYTDYPDSDLNFSYRLQQLTSLEVDPNGKILELTDDELFDYPFIYMIEPGRMWLTEPEVLSLRKYCLNGGFLMVDDFWGSYEWQAFEEQMRRVFADPEGARRVGERGRADVRAKLTAVTEAYRRAGCPCFYSGTSQCESRLQCWCWPCRYSPDSFCSLQES